MDCLSATSPVQRVVFMKGAQIGASEAGNNWLGYIIDQAPGPTMVVQPTVDLAKRYSNQRIAPMIAACSRLAERVAPSRTRDSSNTTLLKEFTGGVLVLAGANSAAGLRSMPARYLFLDEIDAYPSDVEDEGDPVALAEARTRTFTFRSKVYLASTPKVAGTSRIEREFARTDQRRYFVPCPHCGTMQTLVFARLRWRPGHPETAAYRCEHCAEAIEEHHKTAMLGAGEWRPTAEAAEDAPPVPATVRGYHLSALYSPVGWLSWARIAAEWEGAAGDVERRRTFTNTVLGECWTEETESVPDWSRLYERREDYDPGTVPARALFLTAGADVQIDRIEVDVWGWGRDGESWLVDHRVLDGDPVRDDVWRALDALLSTTWEHETGHRMSLQRLAIDSGAWTSRVYAWARNKAGVIAVKGTPHFDRLVPVAGPSYIEITEGGRKIKRGVALWTVSTSFFKRELYRQLQLARPTEEAREAGATYPGGYVHLSRIAGDEWCRQLVAEQQVIVRNRRGFAVRTEWRALRPRNEALDMRVYARAAAWLAGADRWSERRWRDLEAQLGLDPPPPPAPPTIDAEPHDASGETTTAPPAAGRIRRRIVMRRRMINRGSAF